MKKNLSIPASLLITACALSPFQAENLSARETFNFNPGWLLEIGDFPDATKMDFNDKGWKKISLPHAFNEDEAFKVPIAKMTDTVGIQESTAKSGLTRLLWP